MGHLITKCNVLYEENPNFQGKLLKHNLTAIVYVKARLPANTQSIENLLQNHANSFGLFDIS